jgi:DNA mismatch repair protein MSH4
MYFYAFPIMQTSTSRNSILSEKGTPSRSRTQNSSQRPRTSTRPDTATTVKNDSHVILCISEGRGTHSEIGIASMNLRTSECVMSQYSDSSSFPLTFHRLNILQPGVIIMSSTCIDPPSILYQVMGPVMEQRSELISVQRHYYNDTNGMEYLKQFNIQDENSQELHTRISQKYYSLAALSALFRYVQEGQGIVFTNHSIKFKFTNIDGTMFIDSSTASHLELVYNSQDHRSDECLLGILDNTQTAMGKRLLRASILQPLISRLF